MRALLDAHNHLQAPVLKNHFDRILEEMAEAGVGRCVVNGTREEDWPAVAELHHRHPALVHPSFGLHPWYAAGRSGQWLATLRQFLEDHPGAGVGECGLDRWKKGHDLEDQRRVLAPQVELATSLDRPLTLHCLLAWGPLADFLRSTPLPARGFLLHAYGGSRELVPAFTALGAYFSFSGYFLQARKSAQREVFREIPADRLLLETDAPAMPLPEEVRRYRVDPAPEDTNHPANLAVTFQHLATLRQSPPGELRETLHRNETRFFGA